MGLQPKAQTTSPASRLTGRLPATSSGSRVSPEATPSGTSPCCGKSARQAGTTRGTGSNTGSRGAGRLVQRRGSATAHPAESARPRKLVAARTPQRAPLPSTASLRGGRSRRAELDRCGPANNGRHYLDRLQNGRMVTGVPCRSHASDIGDSLSPIGSSKPTACR